MQSTNASVTLSDVERVLPLKSWWAIVVVLPVVRRLTVPIVNRTAIGPNSITIAALALRVAAAGAFFIADRGWLIAGALLFYLAYVFDCMDGAVARLRQQTSEFGRFLDHIGDLIGGLLIVAALSAGQHLLFTALVAGIMFCHIAELYISYLTAIIISGRKGDANPDTVRTGFLGLYMRYLAFFHSRNIKSFFSFPDYQALTFFVFPLIGLPVTGLKVGFCMVLAVNLYTVLASFTAIHTGGDKFP